MIAGLIIPVLRHEKVTMHFPQKTRVRYNCADRVIGRVRGYATNPSLISYSLDTPAEDDTQHARFPLAQPLVQGEALLWLKSVSDCRFEVVFLPIQQL